MATTGQIGDRIRDRRDIHKILGDGMGGGYLSRRVGTPRLLEDPPPALSFALLRQSRQSRRMPGR